VVACPEKSLLPGIGGSGARPFDVRVGGKEGTLGQEHSCAQRNKECQPSPEVVLEEVFSEESADKQEHQNVEQEQTAHGLEPGQGFEAGKTGEHDGRRQVDQFVVNQGPAQEVEVSQLSRACEATEPPQNKDGRQDPQPFVPRPASDVVKPVGQGGLMIGRGWGIERNAEGQQAGESGEVRIKMFECDQQKAVGEGEDRHQGMDGCGKDEKQSCLDVLLVDHFHDGEYGGEGGQVSRVEVLIEDV